jgi:hypothetical protein
MVAYMIKPFTILATKDEPNFGTLVSYTISDRAYIEQQDYKGTQTSIVTSSVLIPYGEDIDTYLLNYLIRCGWIKL